MDVVCLSGEPESSEDDDEGELKPDRKLEMAREVKANSLEYPRPFSEVQETVHSGPLPAPQARRPPPPAQLRSRCSLRKLEHETEFFARPFALWFVLTLRGRFRTAHVD